MLAARRSAVAPLAANPMILQRLSRPGHLPLQSRHQNQPHARLCIRQNPATSLQHGPVCAAFWSSSSVSQPQRSCSPRREIRRAPSWRGSSDPRVCRAFHGSPSGVATVFRTAAKSTGIYRWPLQSPRPKVHGQPTTGGCRVAYMDCARAGPAVVLPPTPTATSEEQAPPKPDERIFVPDSGAGRNARCAAMKILDWDRNSFRDTVWYRYNEEIDEAAGRQQMPNRSPACNKWCPHEQSDPTSRHSLDGRLDADVDDAAGEPAGGCR